VLEKERGLCFLGVFGMRTLIVSFAVLVLAAFGSSSAHGAVTPPTAGVHAVSPAMPSRCARNSGAQPEGLVVVIPDDKLADVSSYREAVSNKFISGVALQINWGDLEPAEGKPNWSKLDQLLDIAKSSGKWVQLLVFPGFFSPPWALKGVQTETFPIQYGPGKGTLTALPMPWDTVYLNRWFAFLKLLNARYGNSPAFRVIAATGPTSVSAEMTLPGSPDDIAKLRADGYTPDKYLDAWQSVFTTTGDDFPNQCVSVSAPGIPLLDQRHNGPAAHAQARVTVTNAASKVLGSRLVLQWSDLHAGTAVVEAPSERTFVLGYAGQILTGFQMRTAAKNASDVMGAAGNPALALRKSIDLGMEPNSNGAHVDYLEIYEPDVLAPEMQPVLRYGASLFKH
jgi:hypothetical protein